MPETETKDRLKELRTALKSKLDENDRLIAAVKIEDSGGVVVSSEQRDAFRSNLAEANEIKSLIEDLEGVGELKNFLSSPGDRSAAVAAAAAAQAAGIQVPGFVAGSPELKSLGARFLESEEFKSLREGGGATMARPWAVDGDLGALSFKDVYTAGGGTYTTIGFGRTQRDPLVPRQFRTARVRDLFPVQQTNANLIDYFRVSGFTNAAATVAERRAADETSAPTGGATDVFGRKPKSALTFTVAQAPVRTIAHYEVAHRNVLDDEPQLRGIIDNELLYGLRLEEDDQILNGDGTGENLLGLLNTPGIQAYTQANTAGTPDETKADALRRAATRAILAYYEPTGYVLHPYDWEDIELTKDSTGQYVLVQNIAVGMEARVWRQPVVDTPAIAEGTFVTGAWGLGAQLYDRMAGNIRIAEQHADFFIRNAIAILAEERLAFAVKRPESFVKGTFVG